MKVVECSLTCQELELKLKEQEMSHRSVTEELENKLFQQTEMQNLELERLKKNHAIELEEQKVTSEQALIDIKYLYE